MNSVNRRDFIKISGLAGAAVALSGTGLAYAAEEDQAAKAEAAIKAITGGAEPKSGVLQLVAPTIAENGAVVPITLKTSGAEVKKMALLVDNNPVPTVFSAEVNSSAAGQGMIQTRIRMRKTSNVRAFAIDAGGNVYGDTKMVKVTIGGCG